MEKNTLKTLTVIGVTVGAIVITKMIIKAMNDQRAANSLANYQKEESTKPKEEQSSAKNYNPYKDAQYIKKLLHGPNILMYPEVNDLIMTLSDDKLRKLYTLYNKSFRESGRSLTQQLEGEVNHQWPFESVYAPSIKRLKAMGLR